MVSSLPYECIRTRSKFNEQLGGTCANHKRLKESWQQIRESHKPAARINHNCFQCHEQLQTATHLRKSTSRSNREPFQCHVNQRTQTLTEMLRRAHRSMVHRTKQKCQNELASSIKTYKKHSRRRSATKGDKQWRRTAFVASPNPVLRQTATLSLSHHKN